MSIAAAPADLDVKNIEGSRSSAATLIMAQCGTSDTGYPIHHGNRQSSFFVQISRGFICCILSSHTKQPTLSDATRNFVAVLFPFLVISAALTPDRIITGLSRLTLWDLLETGDGGFAGPLYIQSWLRTIENDPRPLNVGLSTVKRRAQDRSTWRLLVTTASTWMTSS